MPNSGGRLDEQSVVVRLFSLVFYREGTQAKEGGGYAGENEERRLSEKGLSEDGLKLSDIRRAELHGERP
ncbi:hypothetical protein [Candidatus Hakubella thermalkaliphila]|uniref:hypothetical protein n=1 Tax=Candidatus Hakubella thermalkaliphila TaxID=2754717 RepID=UPI001593B236|nr:hypothetical protein [Candidatus Hakubella thermalkaliphila]